MYMSIQLMYTEQTARRGFTYAHMCGNYDPDQDPEYFFHLGRFLGAPSWTTLPPPAGSYCSN